MNFIKQIFTWWNRQTIGTMLFTLFSGKLKGSDEFGNKYYENRSGKRWVIYRNLVEASNIPPDWYLWIHFMKNTLPDSSKKKKYLWEKRYEPNLTGTNKAYRPKKITERKNIKKKYETWKI